MLHPTTCAAYHVRHTTTTILSCCQGPQAAASRGVATLGDGVPPVCRACVVCSHTVQPYSAHNVHAALHCSTSSSCKTASQTQHTSVPHPGPHTGHNIGHNIHESHHKLCSCISLQVNFTDPVPSKPFPQATCLPSKPIVNPCFTHNTSDPPTNVSGLY